MTIRRRRVEYVFGCLKANGGPREAISNAHARSTWSHRCCPTSATSQPKPSEHVAGRGNLADSFAPLNRRQAPTSSDVPGRSGSAMLLGTADRNQVCVRAIAGSSIFHSLRNMWPSVSRPGAEAPYET
jgi:hypothetical protein